MRYYDIKKFFNSTRPKAPCLQVQSCLRACYRATEVELLIRLQTPSCLCATKPPFLHDRTWQTVYFSPQTHLLGKSDRAYYIYLKRSKSLNSCFITIIITTYVVLKLMCQLMRNAMKMYQVSLLHTTSLTTYVASLTAQRK